MKTIDEITMIDAGCMALASGRAVYIVINPNGSMAVESDLNRNKAKEAEETRPAVAMITATKRFQLLDLSYNWGVEPSKIQEIHMNRRIQPWPREYQKPQ